MNDEFLNDLWGSSDEDIPIKSDNFNSNLLSKEFQDALHRASWSSGFGMVNQRALASQFATWKRHGATMEEVRSMIKLYMSDESMRGNNPGWQDFLLHREQLSATLRRPKSRTDLLEEAYELCTLEAFMLAYPDNPQKA